MTLPLLPEMTIVPLSPQHHQWARQFADAQATPAKATQVYRNTLAVLALKDCLDWVDIATDFTDSDCMNPFLQMAMDVADLKLPGLGTIECRPIQVGEAGCQVPVEVQEERLGFVVVELAAPYQTANILGFAPKLTSATLSRQELQPLEELFFHLGCLQETLALTPTPVTQSRQRLSQWLTGWGEAATELVTNAHGIWRTLSMALDPQSEWVPGFYGLRSPKSVLPNDLEHLVEQLYASQSIPLPSVVSGSEQDALEHLIQTCTNAETRWKAAELLWTIAPGHPSTGVRRVLDLGLLFANQPLSLLVAILPPADQTEEFAVLARVIPLAGSGVVPTQAYLPTNLTLAILHADGQFGLQAQARERDNVIQIKLQASLGETFSIQLRLGDNMITECFEI
jgi:Protein of unknown function (DUF1822)